MDADGHYVVTWTGPDRDTGQTALGTAIYSRLIDPPIEAEAAATPVDVNLTGTSGNDVFEFVGGAAQNTWIVKVNGVVKYVGTNVGTLTFNGLGGQDSVILTGSSAADRVEMWADHATLSSEYYTVVVTNVESITAIGSGGADTAILHDTAGDDTFVVRPGPRPVDRHGRLVAGRGVRDGHRAGHGRRRDTVADVRLRRRGRIHQFARLGQDRGHGLPRHGRGLRLRQGLFDRRRRRRGRPVRLGRATTP